MGNECTIGPLKARNIWLAGRSVKQGLLDLVFPRACMGCGHPVSGVGHICGTCWADRSLIRHPYCRCCGNPVYGAVDQAFTCVSCLDASPGFTQARSAVLYRGSIRQVLMSFKFRKATWGAEDLSALLAGIFWSHTDWQKAAVLAPIPLHPRKEKERGYNQAALLARCTGRLVGMPVEERLLARIRQTRRQTELTAPQRRSNMQNAFRVQGTSELQDQTVILVDDVMTTGATMSEAARSLIRAGAKHVFAASVGRGLPE